MKPSVKPCCRSADTPPRTGVHSIRDFALSALDASADDAAAFPSANWADGSGITTSSANIAERPVTTSVLALAAANARSAASSSSTAVFGEAAAATRTAIAKRILVITKRVCPTRRRGYRGGGSRFCVLLQRDRAGCARYAFDAASSLRGVTLSGSKRTIRYVM